MRIAERLVYRPVRDPPCGGVLGDHRAVVDVTVESVGLHVLIVQLEATREETRGTGLENRDLTLILDPFVQQLRPLPVLVVDGCHDSRLEQSFEYDKRIRRGKIDLFSAGEGRGRAPSGPDRAG